MKLIVYFLLTIRVGFCTENKFEIKTVAAGQNVTLTCPHQTSVIHQETSYWIRLVSGNWPEFLGATFNFMDKPISKIPHIQTKRDGGEFLLRINEAQQNDTGLYYCVKVKQIDFIFMNGTFVRIRGQKSDVTVIQEPLSGAGHLEKPEPLQCLVLSDSEQTCTAEDRVYWFRAGSDHSHPSLLYLQRNSGDECEKSPVAPSTQKCFYNFSETLDAGTFHCAVAACGQILFGNGTKLDYDATSIWSDFIICICFGLGLSLIVLAVLIYVIKGNNENAALQENRALCKTRQADVDTTVVFSVMNADNGGKRKASRATKKIYAAVTAIVQEYWSNPQ